MTRVISGKAKGRRLVVPASGTRPTSDRIRESIFARLESWNAIDGVNALDLFAGSGALGIEALSRGARSATFVDSSHAALRSLSQNIKSCGFDGASQVRKNKALTFLQSAPTEKYELVFVDPPYAMNESELAEHLELLTPMVTGDATIVIERDSRSPEPSLPMGWEILSHRKWGDTAAWFAGPSPVEK